MDIYTQLALITLGLAVGFGIVAIQSIVIARLLHSRSGYFKGGGFLLIGGLQVWGFLRLSSAILKAQAQGVTMPAHLTMEQIARVVIAFIAIGLLIAGYDRMRRDLKALGI